MPTPLKVLLKHLDLSDAEAEVYLASLRLGEATVSGIAHSAKLQRTTTGSILERLRQLGFVSVHQRRGKHVYWIEDPHLLVEQGRTRLTVIEQLAARLHTEYHAEDAKPSVAVFETRSDLVQLMAKVVDELPKGSTIRTWEAPAIQHYQAVLDDELFHAMSQKKVAKGIQTRSLIPSGQEEHIRPSALHHNVTVRVLPTGLMFETSLWVFERAIVIFSGTHTFATRINHRHTAESMRSLFDHLWEQSRSLR